MIAKANAPRCQRCTEAILPGDVRVDTGHTGNFHGRCFVCDQCKGQLREGFVSMNNAFYHYEVSTFVALVVDFFDVESSVPCVPCAIHRWQEATTLNCKREDFYATTVYICICNFKLLKWCNLRV